MNDVEHDPIASLKTAFHQLRNLPSEWHKRDLDLFIEVEVMLFLAETLIPNAEQRRPKDIWTLVTGYAIRGVNDEHNHLRACLIVRERLRYVKTQTSWNNWLRWYFGQPESLRLYRFDHKDDKQYYFRKGYDVPLISERISAYEMYCTIRPQVESGRVRRPAGAGQYQFQYGQALYEVEISETMASFAHSQVPKRDLIDRYQRSSLRVDLDKLLETAAQLDARESDIGLHKPNRWHDRLEPLVFQIIDKSTSATHQRIIEIDGLFHLVGALGAGKSTLIWILSYHLAARCNLHVTVMVGTVVEAIRLSVWLRRMDILAAPALGTNRLEHERKYGLANARNFDPELAFQPDAPLDPALDWMPTPCALLGIQDTPPSGEHPPCHRLEQTGDPDKYSCPLIPVCPVHQLDRDLVNAQVWVVNPMSFLYSSAPNGIGNRKMRLLEAIYTLSDLIIIDEADRVQMQWDNAFVPTQAIAGSENALLDRLHEVMSKESVGRIGRQRAARSTFNRLIQADAQAHTLSTYIYRLLATRKHLGKWSASQQLTTNRLFQRLIKDLVLTKQIKLSETDLTDFRHSLSETLSLYWRNPLHRETGELAEWINRLLATDSEERIQKKILRQWLQKQMGWQRLDKKKRAFCDKLEFCVVYAALMKRTGDIFYQLRFAQDELNLDIEEDYALSDAILNLVPDPPLGILLGSRLINLDETNLGVFNAMRYQGVGRWLMINLPRLYSDLNGVVGAHVLTMSATSWMPNAVEARLAIPPHAVLLNIKTPSILPIEISFRPIEQNGMRLQVSGSAFREANLRQIVRALAEGTAQNPSDLQWTLSNWQDKGQPRRVLLVVNSYQQADWAVNELENIPEWRGRALRLIADDADNVPDAIRAREVEHFADENIDVLVAPLMAIQRGFNILDELGGALIGTTFFLVRPVPPPDDIKPQLMSLNAWLLDQLEHGERVLKPRSVSGLETMINLRQQAYRQWERRLASKYGIKAMPDDLYDEFLRDQFISVWQTVGRMLRGGRQAQVIFVDSAFGEKTGKRHMLRDWYTMLDTLVNSSDLAEKQLAGFLYQSAWQAFKNAFELKEIV